MAYVTQSNGTTGINDTTIAKKATIQIDQIIMALNKN